MKNIRIACSAILKQIYMGKIDSSGKYFKGETIDVTSDCIKAVIEFVGENQTRTIRVDGKPMFEITVKKIQE